MSDLLSGGGSDDDDEEEEEVKKPAPAPVQEKLLKPTPSLLKP